MISPTMEELRNRLTILQEWLLRSENPDFRSLGISEEAVADGDSLAVVEEVIRKRGAAVTDASAGQQRAGKLLLLYLDENLMDGAAAVASRGFFGGLNFPPCDLWLAVISDLRPYGGVEKRTLISWIPHTALSAAQAGIDVNPEECLVWASEGAPGLCELEHL